VFRRHLGDICILAKPAAKIASNGRNGIGIRARKKMKQGLFFNGIRMSGDQTAIDQGHQPALGVFPDSANASFSRGNTTTVGAEVALDRTLRKRFNQHRFHDLPPGPTLSKNVPAWLFRKPAIA
jgi:hypothetical protein